MVRSLTPLFVAAGALIALPFLMPMMGLGVTSATEVVIYAMACMALNILVGYTGLVSFGHGAWFGLAAYAAGLLQRELFPGSFLAPVLIGVGLVALIAAAFGALILRRRGVYFSLLTLALSAMLYTVAFRWTAVTGGEDGLGGIMRPVIGSVNFDASLPYYILVAALALPGRVYSLALPQFAGRQRAGRDPRERAARALSRLRHRPLQADRLHDVGGDHWTRRRIAAVQQSDDLGRADLGRVLRRIAGDGRDRRHALVPRARARRAVLRDLPRLSLEPDRELAVRASACSSSPSSCSRRAASSASMSRLTAPFRKKVVEDAAMAARRIGAEPLPDFLRPTEHTNGADS